MRTHLSELAVIISFYVYTMAATNRPRSFVCERKYFSADVVSKSLENACVALTYSDVSCRFTAAFDGSKLFGIQDAALFSVPTTVCYENRVNSRIVIDSMCNLVGLVYRSKRSYHRCEETFDSHDGLTVKSENESEISTKNFAYRCNGKIFLYQDIFSSYEYLKDKLSLSAEKKAKVNIIRINSHQFGDNEIYLWSIYGDGDFLVKRAGPYRIAVNKAKDIVGLAYRKNNHWLRCTEMQSVDPKPPKVIDGTKNSIGETLFANISPFKCGNKLFSAITLNSHMQAACRVIQEDANKAINEEFSFPMPDLAEKNEGRNTGFWPIRQLEMGSGRVGKGIKRRNIFIKLNSACDFLGVYARVGDKFLECQKL
ncbi:CSEP0155 putative effector protein [Blumeria hordei DH14]|uniref:CSEP0155 putative effector protein n=1 Tax=Blumeria graminis f. sp. hordei (strain DH14) TaxID=546991 RepID=N1JQY7_BLUG1|nr:CSEP0155 putative effector protein [Blumeria hordei DH14]